MYLVYIKQKSSACNDICCTKINACSANWNNCDSRRQEENVVYEEKLTNTQLDLSSSNVEHKRVLKKLSAPPLMNSIPECVTADEENQGTRHNKLKTSYSLTDSVQCFKTNKSINTTNYRQRENTRLLSFPNEIKNKEQVLNNSLGDTNVSESDDEIHNNFTLSDANSFVVETGKKSADSDEFVSRRGGLVHASYSAQYETCNKRDVKLQNHFCFVS